MAETTIGVTDETKREFDEACPDGIPHDMFLQRLLSQYTPDTDSGAGDTGVSGHVEDRVGQLEKRVDDLEDALPGV